MDVLGLTIQSPVQLVKIAGGQPEPGRGVDV